MVDVTPRLEGYVSERDLGCPPTLDETVETLEAIEADVDEATVERELATLDVLADDTRYRILTILLAGDERCVCELDAMLPVSDSAVSHALRRLVDAGLVTRRKEGRWRIYAATDRARTIVEAVHEATAE